MSAPSFFANVSFFGNRPSTLNPESIFIVQEEYMHDTLTMTIWADDATSDAYLSGTPVSVTFGRPGQKRIFYGYVNHVNRVNYNLADAGSLAQRNSVTVFCVGASFWMKQPGTDGWFDQTASQIVTKIAAKFGLSCYVEPDSTVWPVLQMAGMTYWQFCIELAQRIGYTFYCNGTQLVFKRRQTNPNNIIYDNIFNYNYKNVPRLISDFTPVLGANSPENGKLVNRQSMGVDFRTNQVTYSQLSGSSNLPVLGTQQESPLFREIEHFSSSTQQEVKSRNEGLGNANQLYLSAHATLSGNPFICQGSYLNIINANGSQNGLWFVQKAEHSFSNTNYILNLSLGRDSVGSINYYPTPIKTATVPPVSLVNNVWVSQAA